MEPYEGREPYIFISYARKDAERVLPYLDALSVAGYRVWYDADIPAGDNWLKTLLEKVKDCAVFCPLFSKAFGDSKYCAKETNYAIRKDKTIVPLYLEELNREDNWLFDLLGEQHELQLYQYDSPAHFAERLDKEPAFKDCKAPEEPSNKPPEGWQKIGEIQWRLSVDGVLSIARNEDLPNEWYFGSIPNYQFDPVHKGSTAPWALYKEKILSVEIADNIDTIGEDAFYGCRNLTTALIGDGVTEIGNSSFFGCKNLKNVRIPNSVTKIGNCAFFECESLTDVRILDGVTEIEYSAFEGCRVLMNVRIPDSVTTIGDLAFDGCKYLKSIEIPAGAEVGDRAFPPHTRVTRRPAP